MTADGVVLLHGGMHGSWCWSRVLPRLALPAIAPDLPRVDATLDAWAEAVREAIGRAGMRAPVLVAHSLAGLTALHTLSGGGVAGVMFVAAVIPRDGQSYFGTLPRPLDRLRARLGIGRDGQLVMPRPAARLLLCHDLPPADARLVLDNLTPEPTRVLEAPVRHRVPDGVRLAYVHTTRDRAVTPGAQRQHAARLRAPVTRLRLEGGHSVFFTRPRELAGLINAWC
ncbi:alpha/beta fold hydrolase [Nonomuraea typhae]|uniref:Alpha/beta fold hydrolase n=1 Tax=Nonomuraea typhae TaxID=2603600 RepID=A0ABW7Z3G7_9ACTN